MQRLGLCRLRARRREDIQCHESWRHVIAANFRRRSLRFGSRVEAASWEREVPVSGNVEEDIQGEVCVLC